MSYQRAHMTYLLVYIRLNILRCIEGESVVYEVAVPRD